MTDSKALILERLINMTSNMYDVKVDAKSTIEDFELDSMEILDFVFKLEDEFGVEITEEVFSSAHNLNELANTIDVTTSK